MTNFRLFQTERVCRRQFQIDENGRKLSKWVENTVGKGEIARYEQFLLFPQCFQKACFPGVSKGVIVWEWVNPFTNKPLILHVYNVDLVETLWAKEKLLVIRNFCFFSLFSIPGELLIFIKFKIIVCKLFQFSSV